MIGSTAPSLLVNVVTFTIHPLAAVAHGPIGCALVVTVTVATVGIAAWVWSQRNDDEHEDLEPYHHDLDYENADYGDNPPYGASGDSASNRPPPSFGGGRCEAGRGRLWYHSGSSPAIRSEFGLGCHVRRALRRTPSPQQFFDNARKTVAAGVTAAGAAVGSAQSAIRRKIRTPMLTTKLGRKRQTPSGEGSALGLHRRPRMRANAARRLLSLSLRTADSADLDGDDFHEHAVSSLPGGKGWGWGEKS